MMDEVIQRLEILSQQQRTILDKLERIDARQDKMENRIAEMGGGVAVVLTRSETTKKKLVRLPGSFRKKLSRVLPILSGD